MLTMRKPILKPFSTHVINDELNSIEESEAGELRNDVVRSEKEMEMYKQLIKGKKKIDRQKRGAMRLKRSDTHLMIQTLKLEKMKSIVMENMHGSPLVRGVSNNSLISHKAFDRSRA